MFVKINEFETALATPTAASPVSSHHPWPNAVHGLAGLAFLAAWLPVTLLCWTIFGTMILLKFGLDTGRSLRRFLRRP